MPLATHVRPDGRAGVEWSPALAGLRGLAIALVVAFHLGLPLASGGPVGVTSFFVLSGFLITTLLLAEIAATGRVDLPSFLARRVRRLAPAMTVAVVAVLAVAAAVGQWATVVGDALLAMSYASNWARAGGDGMGLWNHAWSLAIEGQFYLVWPIAILVLRRFVPLTSWRAIAVLLTIAAASAVLRIALATLGATDERLYFGTDTRAEALLVGCALACYHARRSSRRLPAWAGPTAVIAVVALAVIPDMDVVWPGSSYTAVAAATGVLILWSADSRRAGLGLSSRPMVWLGERSYSLYLWHVPVIMSLPDAGPNADVLASIVIPAAVSLCLAALSYRYVEQPFRRRRSTAPRTVVERVDGASRPALAEAA